MKKFFVAILALAAYVNAFADEGMWMLSTMNKKVQEYAGAVVSVDFMGTGSIISDRGLVITNHHVAYGDVFALGDADHDYLENGFWARTMAEEIPVPGRHMQILQKTVDVTQEVEDLFASGQVKRGVMAMRKVSGIIEKKYESETGLVASLGSFWSGSRYYVSLYKEYRDIRLVAAPPVMIGAFGGDVDNWEWPQQKGDFAMYRIYTAPDGSPADYSKDNVPLKPEKYLKISDKGYRKGSKTYVIGYPGSTDRYASSFKVDFVTDVTRPIANEVRGAQMEIISRWMNADPEVRRKYSNHFFNLSNAQELYGGEVLCYKRFRVADEKRELEKELDAWIKADPARVEKWGNLLSDLDTKYKAMREAEINLNYYRESMVRGTKVDVFSSRISGLARKVTPDRLESTRSANLKNYQLMDMRVERDIFRMSVECYYKHVDRSMWGPYQTELKGRFGDDYDALCKEVWDGSWLVDSVKFAEFHDSSTKIDDSNIREWTSDKLIRFFEDVQFVKFSQASRAAQGSVLVSALDKEYTHALYQMRLDKKQKQYPNANSTLRVTEGKVDGYSPRDAVKCDWYSTVFGLLEKHDPSAHDFCLSPEWKAALESADPGMHVNFITNNDITGGNSGSPVLNSRGEIIGLAFDGNKESLASDVSFTPDYNRCVNVDIRFVIWTLRNYAHLDNILSEIKQ